MTLLVFLLFLLLNDAEEFITLSLSLLGHHDFFLHKLSSAGDVKILGLFTLKLGLFYFFSACLTLAFFKRSLGPESVDFALTIGSALLELSQTLNLQFFLLFDALSLKSIGLFFGDSISIVTHDFQIFLTLLSELFLLSIEGNSVGDFDLLEHLSVSLSLGLCNLDVLLLLNFNRSHHLLLLALELLPLLDALHLTVLDLLNDNGCATALGLNSQTLPLILSLEGLQALNFHHDVQAFLLGDPLSFQLFVLFELLVPHSDDLGIQCHLVHVLHVVVLLIELRLGLGEETFGLLVLLNLDLSGWQLGASVAVHLYHLLLAGLSSGLLLGLLLFHDLLLLLLLLIGLDLRRCLHTSDV